MQGFIWLVSIRKPFQVHGVTAPGQPLYGELSQVSFFFNCLDTRSKLHVNLGLQSVICSVIQQLVFEFLVYTLPVYFSTVLDFAKEIKIC